MDHDPDNGQSPAEMRLEIIGLQAENVRLRKLRDEDRRFVERRLAFEVTLSKDSDREAIDKQIVELQRTIEKEGAFIDRLVVYMRKRAAE